MTQQARALTHLIISFCLRIPSIIQILTPATAEDLRMAGKMTLSPTIPADLDRIKAVQIKVPVVATVIQNVDPDGKINFIVEPPGPENEHGESPLPSQ